jgi:hypothetical protein
MHCLIANINMKNKISDDNKIYQQKEIHHNAVLLLCNYLFSTVNSIEYYFQND